MTGQCKNVSLGHRCELPEGHDPSRKWRSKSASKRSAMRALESA